MYDIITVGSATMDVFAHTNFSEIIKIKEPEKETELIAYPMGSKILISELRFTTGGGGTNTAVALARLGHKTAWIGKLGRDANSEIILRELKKEGVDSLAVYGRGFTGYSVILDSIEHDRTILAYKGENDNLRFNELNLKKIKAQWFYFSSMLRDSFVTLERLAEYAERNRINVALNISPYLAQQGEKLLGKILSKTSILVLNDEEARLLTGEHVLERQFLKILNYGVKIIAITLGKNGATASDGRYLYRIKARKVKVIESTGAGDAFASGFLSGLLKKNDIEFALKIGKVNAESVITHPGAKEKLLTYKEALGMVKKYPAYVNREKFKAGEVSRK